MVRTVLEGRTAAERRTRDVLVDAVAGALSSVTALLNPAGVVVGGPWSSAADCLASPAMPESLLTRTWIWSGETVSAGAVVVGVPVAVVVLGLGRDVGLGRGRGHGREATSPTGPGARWTTSSRGCPRRRTRRPPTRRGPRP